jgi:hypothetical protein
MAEQIYNPLPDPINYQFASPATAEQTHYSSPDLANYQYTSPAMANFTHPFPDFIHREFQATTLAHLTSRHTPKLPELETPTQEKVF